MKTNFTGNPIQREPLFVSGNVKGGNRLVKLGGGDPKQTKVKNIEDEQTKNKGK